MASTDTYDCDYSIAHDAAGWEDLLKNGYTLAATSISYGDKEYSFTSPVTVEKFYGGPPALDAGYF